MTQEIVWKAKTKQNTKNNSVGETKLAQRVKLREKQLSIVINKREVARQIERKILVKIISEFAALNESECLARLGLNSHLIKGSGNAFIQ